MAVPLTGPPVKLVAIPAKKPITLDWYAKLLAPIGGEFGKPAPKIDAGRSLIRSSATFGTRSARISGWSSPVSWICGIFRSVSMIAARTFAQLQSRAWCRMRSRGPTQLAPDFGSSLGAAPMRPASACMRTRSTNPSSRRRSSWSSARPDFQRRNGSTDNGDPCLGAEPRNDPRLRTTKPNTSLSRGSNSPSNDAVRSAG